MPIPRNLSSSEFEQLRLNRRAWGRALLLLGAGGLVTGRSRLVAAPPRARPFVATSGIGGGLVPAERHVYRLKWGMFLVGEAVLTTGAEPEPVPGGDGEGWPMKFTVTSAGLAERLYRVRTQITSWLPADADRSLGYRKVQDEGGRRRDEVITFDRAAGVARYTNFGQPGGEIAVPEVVHDPLSVLFAVRYGPELVAGQTRVVPVTDGRKLVDVSVAVAGRDQVKVPAGRFAAWRLEPETGVLGGVFRRSPGSKLEIWLAQDAARTPVRLRGSVQVGSFAGELM